MLSKFEHIEVDESNGNTVDDYIVKNTYTNIGVFPYKVVLHPKICSEIIEKNIVRPAHLQINLTDRCNLNCKFCSCGNRNVADELSLADMLKILETAKKLGVKAITIAGGGEPLCHENFNEFLFNCKRLNIPVGLITNGLLLNLIDNKDSDIIKWCRVSYSDDRTLEQWNEFSYSLRMAKSTYPGIIWGISYVVLEKPNKSNIINIVKLADELNYSHVRFTPDLYNIDKIKFSDVKAILRKSNVDTKIVHFNEKERIYCGSKECRVSLLRPLIAANGYIYPCGGIQYMNENRDFVKEMRMGHYTEFEKIINEQKFFNGRGCEMCFFGKYNELLNLMAKGLEHKEWL